MTARRLRDLVAIIKAEGGSIVEVRFLGSGHYRIKYQIGGRTLATVAPYSPSDHRALKNFRADLRRSIRAEGGNDARR